eukprot:361885-Chlamydomonas_euryale.AAC.13
MAMRPCAWWSECGRRQLPGSAAEALPRLQPLTCVGTRPSFSPPRTIIPPAIGTAVAAAATAMQRAFRPATALNARASAHPRAGPALAPRAQPLPRSGFSMHANGIPCAHGDCGGRSRPHMARPRRCTRQPNAEQGAEGVPPEAEAEDAAPSGADCIVVMREVLPRGATR